MCPQKYTHGILIVIKLLKLAKASVHTIQVMNNDNLSTILNNYKIQQVMSE